jgi:hypothetical protein
LSSPLNIGYRHLCPSFPFSIQALQACGLHWKNLPHTNRESRGAPCPPRKGTLTPACAPFLAGCRHGTYQPALLAFFNELAGGPSNGWRFLADSNTDWGQALKTLAAYQKEYHTGPVKLSLFPFLTVQPTGVDYEPIAPMTGAPPIFHNGSIRKWGYAISATTLDGVPLPFRRPTIGSVIASRFSKAWACDVSLRCTAHLWTMGSAMHTQLLRYQQRISWRGFGVEGYEKVTFDCEQSWIVPNRGENPGWLCPNYRKSEQTVVAQLQPTP